jgi:hypothetical protein
VPHPPGEWHSGKNTFLPGDCNSGAFHFNGALQNDFLNRLLCSQRLRLSAVDTKLRSNDDKLNSQQYSVEPVSRAASVIFECGLV